MKKTGSGLRKQKNIDLITDHRQDDEDEELLFPDGFNPFEAFSLLGQKDQQDLDDRGILVIDNYISKRTLARVYKRMLCLHFNPEFTDEIQLILNSPGGYCDAGWALIDLMSFVKNPVKTIAMGEICSMATHIFIAGDTRIMSPNTSAMIHQFSAGTEGNYSDLIATTKSWELEMGKDITHLIRCSKYKTKEQVMKNLLKDTDHWLSPNEMKKHGLCDSVFKPKPRGKK